MKQVALDLAAFDDSFLRGYSHLIIDRDSKYTTEVCPAKLSTR